MYVHTMLHDGSGWFLLACLAILAGTVIGLFTDAGSGISHHPYSNAHLGGQLAADLPPEALGRAEIEPLLRPAARRRRR